jgi:hypothetical protein
MEVAVLKTFTPNRDAIMIRFSLRKSGTYKIYCRYWRWFNFMGSPSIVEVQPGSFCVPNTILQVQNPECISVTVDQWILLPLVPRDRYGNSCIIQDEEIDKFGFVVKRVSKRSDSKKQQINSIIYFFLYTFTFFIRMACLQILIQI